MPLQELRVEVVVPKGCEKGEIIDVTTPRGSVLAVELPPEACDDDLVVVHYTHDSDIVGLDVHHNAPQTHVLEVRNPTGSMPGDAAQIITPHGEILEVDVPADATPGSTFLVEYEPTVRYTRSRTA